MREHLSLTPRAGANLRGGASIVELSSIGAERCEQCSMSADNMPNQKQNHSGEAGSGFVVHMARKSTARQEYRLKQRARIEASPVLAKKFPRLKGLKATLEYFDAAGITKNGGLKCKLNVAIARS